jgi:hemolysin activation/secretion protein
VRIPAAAGLYKSNQSQPDSIGRGLKRLGALALLVFVTQTQCRELLTGTVITGSTAYTPEALFPLYRESLGHEIDAATMRVIVTNIESKYLHDGYFRPLLVIREDLLALGILRVDVYEARVTDLRVNGDAGPHQSRVSRLTGELLAQPLLRQQTIPQALKALRALPGLTVDASTHADLSVSNGVVLSLQLRYRPISARIEWTNWGTSQLGPDFLSTTLTANGLFGGREQLSVLLVTATNFGNYHGAGASFATELNQGGTTVSVTGFHSASQPSFSSEPIDLAYPHDVGGLRLTQPLLDRDRQSLRAYLGVDYNDSLIQYQGVDLQSDRLRVAFLGAQVEGRLAQVPYGAALGIRRGINGLGSGIVAIDGSTLATNYTVATGETAILVPLNGVLTTRLSLLGQWSADVLPYEERFKIGSDALARAFKTAEFAGDSGVGMKAELRARIGGIPARFGAPSAFTYADYGQVWQRDLSIEQHAATAGFGFRWEADYVAGSLELAKPVAVSPYAPHGWSVLGDLSVQY